MTDYEEILKRVTDKNGLDYEDLLIFPHEELGVIALSPNAGDDWIIDINEVGGWRLGRIDWVAHS